MLESEFEVLLFYKKNIPEKKIFFKILLDRYFLLVGCAVIIFGLF